MAKTSCMAKTSGMAQGEKSRGWGLTVAVLGLGVWLLGGCGASDTSATAGSVATESAALTERHGGNPNPALFPKDARPYGRSMEFWAEQWWRWIYSIPAANNPFLDRTLDSNQNQSGPVFFLAGGDRTSTVTDHRAIAVMASSVMADFPCPDPTYHPAPGQSVFDFLLPQTTALQDSVISVDATLDGQALTGLLGYRATSDDLAYVVGDLSLQAGLDSCITGRRQPMVVDAIVFMIKPLERGQHVLTTRVANSAGGVYAHTHILNVQ